MNTSILLDLKYIAFLLPAILFIGCGDQTSSGEGVMSSAPNTPNNSLSLGGAYCAEVTYENPNTGTHSNYLLSVECAGDQLTSIHWPQGGELDADHFTPPTFTQDSLCSFTTDEGKKYTVHLIGDITLCESKFQGQLHQCTGTTKSGDRCKRLTGDASGLCWQHGGKKE